MKLWQFHPIGHKGTTRRVFNKSQHWTAVSPAQGEQAVIAINPRHWFLIASLVLITCNQTRKILAISQTTWCKIRTTYNSDCLLASLWSSQIIWGNIHILCCGEFELNLFRKPRLSVTGWHSTVWGSLVWWSRGLIINCGSLRGGLPCPFFVCHLPN